MFYGWYIVGFALLAGAASAFASFYIVTVVQIPMAASLETTRIVLLTAFSIRALVSIAASPVVGAFVDQAWSPKAVFVIGGLLGGGATVASGLVTATWQLYVLQVIAALALAPGDILTQNLIVRWFERKRGRALGIASMGVSIGSVILIPIAAALASGFGWRYAWFLAGGALIAVKVLGGLFVVKPWPADMGLRPDGETSPSEAEASQQTRSLDWSAKEAARTPALWYLTLASNFMAFAGVAVIFAIPPYAADSGLPAELSTLALTAYPMGAAITRPLSGFIAERIPARTVYLTTLAGLTVVLALLATSPSGPTIVVLTFLAGFFVGSHWALQYLLLAEYFGIGSFGAIQGITRPVNITTQTLAPILPAFIHDLSGSHGIVFAGLAALPLTGMLLLALTRRPERRTSPPKPASAKAPSARTVGETR